MNSKNEERLIKECDNNSSLELFESLQELEYMETHPEEYKSYSNIEELKKDLLSDD